jgi:hypothetical protein
MDSSTLSAILVIAVVVVVILVLVGVFRWFSPSRRRSKLLRERFGPEYDYLVKEIGRQKAEAELEARQERVKSLDIHLLTPAAHERFSQAWRLTQAHFVDNPARTLAEADRLVTEVMQVRVIRWIISSNARPISRSIIRTW